MMVGVRRLLLRWFGTLPVGVRRFIVRRVAPAWTVGSVALVERDDGRWLMVKPVYRRGWSLPGGIIDRGEAPADAAVRELGEELGIRIELHGDPWVIVDSGTRQVETVFRAVVVGGTDLDAITVRSHELEDVGWFDPEDPPLIERETADVVAVIRHGGPSGPKVLLR